MIKAVLAAGVLITILLLLTAGLEDRTWTTEGAEQERVLDSLTAGKTLTTERSPQPQPRLTEFTTDRTCAPKTWTPTTQDKFYATVTRVIDGDTLEILAEGEKARLRLWGIDAPEMDQTQGQLAKKMLEQLTENESITVHAYGLDKYGRILGLIETSDQKAVNATLVEKGAAYHYPFGESAGHTCLTEMEKFARQMRIGVWQKDPRGETRPWERRREIADGSERGP